MKEYFKEMLEYSHYHNQELIQKFTDGDLHYVIPETSKKIISHILNAQTIWNNRIIEGEVVDIWKVWESDKLQGIEEKNITNTLEILNDKDLDTEIEYSNSKGENFKDSIKDILFHVVNHSTYHRGQIATEFRREGIDPIVSDFIHYKRKA